MRKGYFINCRSFKDQNDLLSCGVSMKVIAQIKVLSQYTVIVHDLHNMYGKYTNQVDKLIRRLPFTGVAERWKYDKKYSNADFIYFRKDVVDYSVYSFLKKIKKNNPEIKILFEVATYPYDAEINHGVKTFPFYLKDIINRNRLHKCVDRIITYSQHDEIFKVKTIKTLNGFDFNSVRIAQYKISNESINIISVSTNAYWHGYDRFLIGLGEYYRNSGDRNIVFHIVGDGAAIPQYKQIVEKYNIDAHVVFYGKKYGVELDNIYDMCSLAIECLGNHRKDLYLSSSLKSREYAARGLPIITSTSIDFLSDNFKYCFKIPEDESIVDIQSVITFYDEIFRDKSSSEIAQEIRNYAKQRIDMDIVMKPIINFINGGSCKMSDHRESTHLV